MTDPRTPPHSDRAERNVLGAVMINNELIDDLTLAPSDFYRPKHQPIFSAMLILRRAQQPIDLTTLADMLETSGDLESDGLPYLAALPDDLPKSTNCQHYAAIVAEKSRRRRILGAIARASDAATNGIGPAELDQIIADLARTAPAPVLSYWSDLSALGAPLAGETLWCVENLIPAGDYTLLAATWKTAKTLACYELALSAATGTPVWGRFAVPSPRRVQVWQFEMPLTEDIRRLERLCRGRNLDPADFRQHHNLLWANRPLLDLSDAADIQRWHRAVLAQPCDLLILDSALAAFCSSDLNDNAEVRRVLARALLPLTARGIAIIVLHHYRKPSQGGADDQKGKVLGAQAFAAAAGRIYGLERLPGTPSDAHGSFKLKLGLLGSWSPGDTQDVILGVEDTENGLGTTVTALDETAQLSAGGLFAFQKAALNIKNQLHNQPSVLRADAILRAQGDLSLGTTAVKKGLDYAIVQGWVRAEQESGKGPSKLLVRGPNHSPLLSQ